jgi:hypothetical protein
MTNRERKALCPECLKKIREIEAKYMKNYRERSKTKQTNERTNT